ncbi:hypothetical protein GCM10011512_29580 [Tersicoccus solisilvae]|uniref:Integral membrane protein n=1 Tax=Tersicoccus solisilvae TaxID=1882339 RepID=A0ABQ1PQ17_9MICC|nr:hypothetical protein [Tersicoccus solisilvae]GGD00817.1 hypothetical protein GCM10011512_29580 [Tersicoccus solisilvae]
MNERPSTAKASGPGRLIIAVYAIFALAASARAAFQIATKFGDAPLAYALSAFAAAVYIVATVCLASRRPGSWTAAVVAVSIELAGVVVVGLLSVLDPTALPHDTVWSVFGRGYGFVPLVLPVVGLWWLFRNRPGRVLAGARAAGGRRGTGA